jgi:microcystin-dependent protein
VTIAQANIPSYSLTVTDPGHNHNINNATNGSPGISNFLQVNAGGTQTSNSNYSSPATTGISVSSNGGGVALPAGKVQPTIVCNYIIRII